MLLPIMPAVANAVQQESNLKTAEMFLDLRLDDIDRAVQGGFGQKSIILEDALKGTINVEAYIIDILLKMLNKSDPQWQRRVQRMRTLK